LPTLGSYLGYISQEKKKKKATQMSITFTLVSVLIILWAIGTSAKQNEVNTMRSSKVKEVMKQAEIDRQIEEIIQNCEQARIDRERQRKYRENSRGCGWYSS
jgi:hypothetical protein